MGRQRVAVVTASASGIGLSIAEALARDGLHVVMCDVDSERGRREAHRLAADFRVCDVRDEAQLQGLFDDLKAVFALVNNVGIGGPNLPIHEYPVEAFRDVIEVNLVSHFRAARLAIPGMIAAREGVIINISSVAGRIGYPNRSPYTASKWGILGMTRTMANELGPYGIRANAVLPGAVRGAHMERVTERLSETEDLDLDTARSLLLSRQAINRFIEPEEIAETVSFLVSDRASAISGAFVDVNGYYE